MGNSLKYNKIGGMHIELQKVLFHEGEPIQGVIHFSLDHEMPPCHLEFQFKGKERAVWEKQTGKTRSRFTGTHIISKSRYILRTWDYPIPIGGYSIPFTFQPPPDIPASFQFSHGSTRALIFYKISTKLLSKDFGLKNKQMVYLSRDLSSVVYPENILRELFIHTWCCIPRGSMHLNAKWDYSDPSRPLSCIVDIDNRRCRAGIKGIIYGVYYWIRLQSDWGFTEAFSVPTGDQKFEVQIPAGEERTEQNAIRLELDFSGVKANILNIHTTTGRLVQCKFFVQIRPQMDGTCMVCCNQPKYNFYFPLMPEADIQPVTFPPPLNWSPSLLENVSLLYSHNSEVNLETEKKEKRQTNGEKDFV